MTYDSDKKKLSSSSQSYAVALTLPEGKEEEQTSLQISKLQNKVGLAVFIIIYFSICLWETN